MKIFTPFPVSYSKVLLFIILITATCIQPIRAQVEKSSELFKTLAEKDSLLFNQGFNRCNYMVLENIISTDLEFYHDVSGVQNRTDFFKATRENICSDPKRKPIRKLVSGSLTVFPLKNMGQVYGAIQKGTHRFYIKEPNKDLYLTSTAKFTHVWILVEDTWKLKTVLSYDHQGPT
jgi:hypothetical protein